MSWTDVLWGLALAIFAYAAWRNLLSNLHNLNDEVVPQEARFLERYYAARGFKVLSVQREGTRAIMSHSIRRSGPIRTYVLTVERPDGVRETRLRGVARGERESLTLWRFDKDGKPEQMF